MKQWLNQHSRALLLILERMRRNWPSTLMMACVMGVTLCLPGILYVVVDSLDRLAGNIQGEPQISLFLKLELEPKTISEIKRRLTQHPEIKNYQFVSKEKAWQQLKHDKNGADMLASLEQNPLPDAFLLQPKAQTPEKVEKLQKELQQWPGVELALVDASWIKRLHAVLELGNKAIMVLAALLSFALVAIIGNTIRLQILTQLEEIEVSRLIGATNAFIRRPFLYAGVFYGLWGGLVAWLILVSIISLFNYSVADIAELYSSQFRLNLPSWRIGLVLIVSAISLGWLGSYIAVQRSLFNQK
ncbi:MAG: ABC transporter permease [Methylophilaceae bacterium]|nr:ABC transporter permease [Methylophilaceae bacterium]